MTEKKDHPPTAAPRELLDLVKQGTVFFLEQLGTPDDEHLREDSLLPGWTRAHVVGHLARNADAIGNLVNWAKTGVETPMYSSPGQRNSDIESSARQSAKDLLSDVRHTAELLERRLAGLSDADWGNTVRTAQGRTISATKIPWLRVREVWLHAVDLDSDPAAVDALPLSLVDALVDEMVRAHGAHPETGAFTLAPTDRDLRWSTNLDDANPVVIEAPAARLLAWLSGRDKVGKSLKVAKLGLAARARQLALSDTDHHGSQHATCRRHSEYLDQAIATSELSRELTVRTASSI